MTVLSADTFGVCVYQSHIITMFHLKMSLSLYAAVSRSLGSVQDQLTAAVQSATDTALKDGIASILHTKVPFHSQIIFLCATKGTNKGTNITQGNVVASKNSCNNLSISTVRWAQAFLATCCLALSYQYLWK